MIGVVIIVVVIRRCDETLFACGLNTPGSCPVTEDLETKMAYNTASRSKKQRSQSGSVFRNQGPFLGVPTTRISVCVESLFIIIIISSISISMIIIVIIIVIYYLYVCIYGSESKTLGL